MLSLTLCLTGIQAVYHSLLNLLITVVCICERNDLIGVTSGCHIVVLMGHDAELSKCDLSLLVSGYHAFPH
jgi:hypothetical protein